MCAMRTKVGNMLKSKDKISIQEMETKCKGAEAMAALTSMMNIGREMERKLTAVGIDSSEKLIETGAEQAFLQLKGRFPQVCLVHLYALEGAIMNVEFNSLSEDKKKELKAFSDFLNA